MVLLKKWIVTFSLVILLLLGYVVASVLVGLDGKNSAEEKASKIAINEGGLTRVDDFYLYNGNKSYSVVVGPDDNGTDQVLWIPSDLKKESIKKMKYSEGYSKSEIINRVQNDLNPYEIVSVKLGMKKNNPIWEVTIKDEKDNLIYKIYDFKK